MLRVILSQAGVFLYVHSTSVLLPFSREMIDSKRNSFMPGRVICISSFLTVVNLLAIAILLMSLVSTFFTIVARLGRHVETSVLMY